MPSSSPKFFELVTFRTIFSPPDFRSSHIPRTHPAVRSLRPSHSLRRLISCSETQLEEVRGVQGGEEIDRYR